MSQPAPKPNDLPSMHDLVAEFIERQAGDASWKHPLLNALRERKTVGFLTYGTPLQPFNGRDALQDAFEELLDATVYLRQAVYESNHAEQKMPELEYLFKQTVEMSARTALALRHRQLPEASPKMGTGDWRLFWVNEESEVYAARSVEEARAFVERLTGEPVDAAGEVIFTAGIVVTNDETGEATNMLKEWERVKVEGIDEPFHFCTGYL